MDTNPASNPSTMETHAESRLSFIRSTMVRASCFTAVPGWGGVFMGMTAILAAISAFQSQTFQQWIITWLGEAIIGVCIGVVTGGIFSVKIIPAMGCCFIVVGIVALLTPPGWGNTLMAVGFGGLHMIFGIIAASPLKIEYPEPSIMPVGCWNDTSTTWMR